MLIDISKVNWRKDRITREYVEEHDVADTDKMSETELACTITYCQTISNPYTEEICRRANVKYHKNMSMSAKSKALDEAAAKFSIRLG